jgi:HPt (histidine-containing phosphotransfer) domain-containing protein
LQRLYTMSGDDVEEVSDIVNIYIKQMSESLEKLDEAIRDGNASEVNLLAHNCLGVSANCGIVALVEPFRELKRMAEANQLAGSAACSAQARKEFERVRSFLQENLQPAVA